MTVIEEGSTTKSAGATNFKPLAGLGHEHQRFIGVDSKESAHVNLPGVHVVGSQLKRWLTGTLHYTVSQEYLAYYLDEYTPSGSTAAPQAADCCSTGSSSRP